MQGGGWVSQKYSPFRLMEVNILTMVGSLMNTSVVSGLFDAEGRQRQY
jgi:hypothetical protein